MNLGPPPAHADEQEAPIVEELRRLAFEGMADELENPSDEEQSHRVQPQAVKKDAGYEKREREQNGWNAQGVTHAVYPVPMTRTVLRDPLLTAA